MAESCLIRDDNDGIHHLRLNHGSNALDFEFMTRIRNAVVELEGQGAPPLIISSTNPRIFSPGWNMKLLSRASRQEVEEFLGLFNALIHDLFSYSGPTAAAVSGHAVAGGCLLAMTCDFRAVAAGPSRIGLSELNLGVPVPAGCVRMLSARLAPSVVDALVFGGDGFTADEALKFGIAHRLTSLDNLGRLVEQYLGGIASKPRQAYRHSKRFLCESIAREMKELDRRESPIFIECWFSKETQDRILALAQQLET